MSRKDLKAKLTVEPIEQMIKTGGATRKVVVNKPQEESEDELLDILTDPVDLGEYLDRNKEKLPLVDLNAPTKFSQTSIPDGQGEKSSLAAKWDKRRDNAIKNLNNNDSTGFGEEYSYVDKHASLNNGDDIINRAIMNTHAKVANSYKQEVVELVADVEKKYKNLPSDWKDVPDILEAVATKISRIINLPKSKVVDLILDI